MNDKSLRKRPIKLVNEKDIKPSELEKIFSHYDNRITELDQRRISLLNTVEEGADDSETIQNILSALNSLLQQLNNSDLTRNR